MDTWSVWTEDQDGEKILVTDGLTQKQARDIAKHLRTHASDFSICLDLDLD